MTTVAIMQPTYLPWMGYFDMIDQADVFVLLDTVQVERKSWQTRNRILARDEKVIWLSIPTHAHRGDLLYQVEIVAGDPWAEKHSRTLRSAYSDEHIEILLSLYGPMFRWKLPYFTGMSIWRICHLIGIEPAKIRYASDLELPVTDDPGRRILDICEATGASELLNTPGAQHLYDQSFPYPIRWHDYQPQPYEQNGNEFIPYLSVVDCLARHGPERTLEVIRAGRHTTSLA